MKNLRKLSAMMLFSFMSLVLSAPALADVVMDPFYDIRNTEHWVFWAAIGIALIALAVLVYLVIKAKRNKK